MATTGNKSAGTSANSNSGGTSSGGNSAGRSSGTGRRLGENPMGAMAAGFAVGAVLGAVIPGTRRERDALQPLASKVNDAARTAARQAAESGRDKLNQLTGEVVTQVGSKVVDAVGGATS